MDARCEFTCVALQSRRWKMTDTSRIDERAEALVCELVKQGVFRIDDLGQVWRMVDRPGGEKLHTPRRAEYEASNGYFRIKVSIAGVRLDVAAHRIVFRIAYNGIAPGYVVDHLDRDKKNNHPSNLQAVTVSENNHAAYSRGSRVGFARRPTPSRIDVGQAPRKGVRRVPTGP